MATIDNLSVILLFVTIVTIFYQWINGFVSPKISKKLVPEYNNFSMKNQLGWNSRFTSTVSGIILCTLSILSLLNADVRNNVLSGDFLIVQLQGIFAVGYFVSDSIDMATNYEISGGSIPLVCHHSLSLFGYSTMLITRSIGYFASIRTLAELSQPLLHFRWMLSTMGLKKSRIYFINGTIFSIMFFLFRICSQYIYYRDGYAATFEGGFKELGVAVIFTTYPLCVLVDILNWYWFTLIVRGYINFIKDLRAENNEQLFVPIVTKRPKQTFVIHYQ